MTVETTTSARRSVRRRSEGEGGPHVVASAPESRESRGETPAARLGTSWLFAAWVVVSTIVYLAFMVGGRLSALVDGWRGG